MRWASVSPHVRPGVVAVRLGIAFRSEGGLVTGLRFLVDPVVLPARCLASGASCSLPGATSTTWPCRTLLLLLLLGLLASARFLLRRLAGLAAGLRPGPGVDVAEGDRLGLGLVPIAPASHFTET